MASVRADGREGGTPEARLWESFCGEHRARLVGLAGLVCGEVASAEDIVQTALERAWRARAALRDGRAAVLDVLLAPVERP
jgi:DNA-directed RNA polymerase specialized sigma24 family protein